MEGYKKGVRDEESFQKGYSYQIEGEESKYKDEQSRIQRAIEEAERLLEEIPMEDVSKVRERIAELRGRLEAFKGGMEAGALNPNGNVLQEYDEYIKQLEKETKENAEKRFKESLRIPGNLRPFPSANTTGMPTGQKKQNNVVPLYNGRGE